MNTFDDTTLFENTDLTEDKLLILDGNERLKYFNEASNFRKKKNVVKSVVQCFKNLAKF